MGLALIKSIDDAVGGVMAKLRAHGLEENTLVLFASDNGAPTKMGRNGPDCLGTARHEAGLGRLEQRTHAWRERRLAGGRNRVPMFAY